MSIEPFSAGLDKVWPAPDVPVLELDRALRPLRRVLAFAMRDLETHGPQIRYFETNGGRWIRPVLGLEFPEATLDEVKALVGLLDGFDAAEWAERKRRLEELYQGVARLDAQLGLPIETKLRPPDRTRPTPPIELESVEEPAVLELELEFDDDELLVEDGQFERRFRLGEPGQTGRNLGLEDASSEVLSALAEEGVETVADLLQLAPQGEEVLRPVYGAGRDVPAGRVAVSGRVRRRATWIRPGQASELRVIVQGMGPLTASWVGGSTLAIAEALAPEARVVLVGELSTDADPVLRNAEIATADGNSVVLPKYGIEGVDESTVRSLIRKFLPELDRVRDPMPPLRLARLGLPGFAESLRDSHLRGSQRPQARRRLAFDEALILQLGLATPRFQTGRERGIAHGISHALVARLCQIADITLNDSQQLAFEDIKRDLRSNAPMLRLLTGQAGAGEWVVALLSAVVIAENKSQVLWCAPDVATAEREFQFIEAYLREVGIVARLVTGDPVRAQRDAIRRGEVHVLVGGLDLLDRDIEFRRLGLVVAHERTAFGTASLKVAGLRAPRPDLLVVSQTPVPTAVLLSAFGDHDLSVIETPASSSVQSEIFQESSRDAAYQRANEAIDSGRQVYVVFPTVKVRGEDPLAPTDVVELKDGRQLLHRFEEEMFPGRKIALFHGAMSREERQRSYDDLVHRRAQVLVCTAPIEDTPPISAASVLVVEQADRLDLTRMQRLRGRVRNGNVPGQALWIVGESPDPEGLGRVQRVAAEADDWAIAELEVQQTGLERWLARDVAGGTRLRWLDPTGDRDLLLWAREEAHAILEEDPTLRRGQFGDIGRSLRDRWEDMVSAPCPLPDAGGAANAQKRRRRRRKRK